MDRVQAAKSRLVEVSGVARQAREAGPPCSDCRYRTLLKNCGNPAYANARFDPATGVYEETFFTPVAVARASDGLCGPEALLFEPQIPVAVAAQRGFAGARAIMAYLTGGIVVLGLAAQLLR